MGSLTPHCTDLDIRSYVLGDWLQPCGIKPVRVKMCEQCTACWSNSENVTGTARNLSAVWTEAQKT